MRKFDTNSLYVCPPYLYTVATLAWEIQKKSFFQQYYSYILQIIIGTQCIIDYLKSLGNGYIRQLKMSSS